MLLAFAYRINVERLDAYDVSAWELRFFILPLIETNRQK